MSTITNQRAAREGTLLLTRRDIAELLSLDECIAAVEQAFRLHGEGKTPQPGILGIPAQEGGFHIKAATLELAKPYFAVKVNGNFMRNMERFGMPNILGVIVLCHGEHGYPLALMDSIEITIQRTGAATAVAAKHFARLESRVATVCGCGNQGRIQLRALTKVLPIERVYAFDTDERQAQQFSSDLSNELHLEVRAVQDLAKAVGASDVCVTCTPSRRSFLNREYVAPGAFIAAVGADAPEKQELDPTLLASSTVVVDILDQCATIGELHHALEQGLITRAAVHAELGEVVVGRKPGRTSAEEIVIFDSTGTALQDVAAAALAYEKALAAGVGITLHLAG